MAAAETVAADTMVEYRRHVVTRTYAEDRDRLELEFAESEEGEEGGCGDAASLQVPPREAASAKKQKKQEEEEEVLR